MNDSPKINPAELGVTDPTRLDGDVPVISRENLPEQIQPLGFSYFRKTSLTLAGRIDGRFAVETSEGLLTCQDGWLAFDKRGYPYPIADDEFVLIYEPASAPIAQEGQEALNEERGGGWSDPFEGEDGQWYFHLKAANGEVVAQSEGYTRPEDAAHGVEAAKRAAA